jgi:hypothetical protein
MCQSSYHCVFDFYFTTSLSGFLVKYHNNIILPQRICLYFNCLQSICEEEASRGAFEKQTSCAIGSPSNFPGWSISVTNEIRSQISERSHKIVSLSRSLRI